MQTSKSRSCSLEAPKKVSLKAARQVKPATLKCDSASSSNQAGKISKERSPKILGRSPRTPLSEKKCQNRISELESQISLLQKDLRKAKEQLHSSKSRKERAQLDAEMSTMSSNLKESQLSFSKQVHPKELQKRVQQDDQSLHSTREVTQKQHSIDSVALSPLVNVMQQLKVKLQAIDESRTVQTKHAESASEKHCKLKKILTETLSIMANMKNQLQDCEVSETQVQALISETMVQLETAKETVEVLGSDSTRAFEDWKSVTLELDESRDRVNVLEVLVGELGAVLANVSWKKGSRKSTLDKNRVQETAEEETTETEQVQADFHSLQSDEQLKSAEAKNDEEQVPSTLKSKTAIEAKDVNSDTNLREVELKKELEKSKVEIEEFKAKLLDRETELQSISEENLKLNSKLEKTLSSHRVYELEKELEDLKNCIADLKANLLDKETEFQSVSEENEMLISEISKRETIKSKVKEDATTELVPSGTSERETQVKLGTVMEEADRSSRKSAGLTELEVAQAANAEMEMELRTLKVQSEQWRKAAEAAAAMISAGSNGEFMGRTGSMDSNYNPITGKISSLYSEDPDDDLLRKKNVNVLRKIGVLWKKPQK